MKFLTTHMRFSLRILGIALAAVTLSACSTIYGQNGWIKSHNNDYQQAQSVKPVTVPSNLSQGKIDNFYPIPGTKQAVTGAPPLTPPGLPTQVVPVPKVKS